MSRLHTILNPRINNFVGLKGYDCHFIIELIRTASIRSEVSPLLRTQPTIFNYSTEPQLLFFPYIPTSYPLTLSLSLLLSFPPTSRLILTDTSQKKHTSLKMK